MKLFVSLAFLVVLLASLIPASSFALIKLNLTYPEFGNITLDEKTCQDIASGTVTNKICGQNPNSLIAWIYYFIVGIAGLAAFIMLVWGGVQWLTSGAIPSQAGEARDKIRNAILGLLLVLASFLVIQIINPELTILKVPGFPLAVGVVPGLPVAPTETVTLTANGKEFTSIKPGEKVTLDWNSSIGSCTGLSNPAGLWSGAKAQIGNEVVDTSTQPEGSLLRFTINCKPAEKEVEASAFVTVSSSPPSGELPTLEYFEAKNKNAATWLTGLGPFTCCKSGDDLGPDDQIQFRWKALADSCFGEDQLSGFVNGPTSGTVGLLVPSFTDTYSYALKCVNINGDASASILIYRVN